MNETINSWEVNQGKRLIKRLQKSGVAPGLELAFLHQALMNAAAAVAVDQAKGEGLSAEESTARAMAMMGTIKEVEPSGHMGLDCYRLLVANGSAPGRVKAELDKVLFVAGISTNAPNDNGPLDCIRTITNSDGFVVLAVDEADSVGALNPDVARGSALDAMARNVGIERQPAVDQESADRFPQHSIPRENY